MGECELEAAIYIRVSTIEQADEGYSLAAQEKILRDYCMSHGYEVYDVYAGKGISAKDIAHRPQMQRLLADAKQHRFDAIIVWKLTRFTRSMTDLCTTCESLDRIGIKFISLSETFDSTTSAGRMMRNILGTVAQWEREVISDNVKLALEERTKSGKITFAYMLGYDVSPDRTTVSINEDEAAKVRWIFEEYLKSPNIYGVARKAREHNLTGKHGVLFSSSAIDRILSNFSYCGYFSWHNTPIKASFPPIISAEEYNKVQSIIAYRGKKLGRRKRRRIVFLDGKEYDAG